MTEKDRLWSVDALRGLDMMFISGLGLGIQALVLALGGTEQSWLWQEFMHSCEIAGCWKNINFEDTIFPLFLFISGISFPWSLSSQRKNGHSTLRIVLACVRRMALLWVLGWMYGGILNLKFGPGGFNGWISILSRIGTSWMFAAFVYMATKTIWQRAAAGLGVALLLFLLRTFVPVLFARQNAGFWQHMLNQILDIMMPLAGMIACDVIRRAPETVSGTRKATELAVTGVVLWGIGQLVRHFFYIGSPIASVAGKNFFFLGWGFMAFALFYYVIDVLKIRRWTKLFRVWGMNSITIYLAQPIFIHATTKYFVGGLSQWMPEDGVQYWIAYMTISSLFLWFLYRKNVFIRV